MKNIFKLTLLFVICLFSISLFGCNNDSDIKKMTDKYNKYFETSLDSAKQVSLEYNVNDKEVTVYKSLIKVKFNENNCDVSVTESKLNSKYVLESNENSYTLD